MRQAQCNEGCNNRFHLEEFKTDKLSAGIKKTYFECPHCGHEYVAFYTDLETRKLQEKMRRLHKRFVNPTENKQKLMKQERKIQKQIKNRMDFLKVKFKGE